MNHDEQMPVAARVCGGCRHWHKMDPPPAGPLLRKEAPPEHGSCRWGPPQLLLLPNGTLMADYPQILAVFPACGQWEAQCPS